MNNVVMKASDTLAASMAECFVTIGGRRYNMMQMIDLEAKMVKNKLEIPILGKTGKGNRAAGWKGEGSGKLYYNTSVFREVAKKYKETGEDMYFEVQITNEDPSSFAGRQTITLYQCNFDEIILAKFSAGEDALDEDISFTFDDWDIPESFKELEGM